MTLHLLRSEGSWADLWSFDLASQGARLLEIGQHRRFFDASAIERSSRFASTTQAQRFLASRAALWLVLAEYGVGYQELDYGPHGKPSLGISMGFNLSRTGDVAVVAVASADVGVDIEQRRSVDLTEPIVAEVGSTLRRIGWPPRLGRDRLQAWTVMEAWTKYHGLSLHRLLDEREVASRMIDELESRTVQLVSLALSAYICGAMCTGSGAAVGYESGSRLL